MRKRPVFIIPGFRHKPKHKPYKAIAAMLKKEGYWPLPVSLSWKEKTISENTEIFLEKFKRVRTKEKYILGFSFGAMIAFLASTKVRVSGLVLCSLSPYFKEDLSVIPETWSSQTMQKRYQDFSKLHHASLIKQIKAKKVFLLYGEKEEKSVITRVKKTYKKVPARQKYLLPIEDTRHEIGNTQYLQTIKYTARVLH